MISEVSWELREIKLAAKPEAMLVASPKGTVPVLVLPDAQVIDESLDIMRWALGQHDPERWLLRQDPALIALNDEPFKHHLDRYKYPERYHSDPMVNRQEALHFLSDLDRRLADSGQLCGPVRGFTDLAIAPFVRQFSAVDPQWFASQPLPHLQGWLSGHTSSHLFEAIMVRFAPWQPGDVSTPFPAAP